MVKSTISITIDQDLLDEIKQLHINLSGTVNEFLQGLVSKYTEDVSGINARIERIRIAKLTKQYNHIQTQLKASQLKLDKWEEVQEQKKEDRAKKEKEDVENAMKCINCSRIIDPQMKSHKFEKGIVCHNCLMTGGGDDIKRWNDA